MDYHSHEFQIYYEDTDLSGIVYHANYLKYFERAREHLLGVDELVDLYYQQGIGFVVYKAELTFKEGARLGDALEVRTKAYAQSEYRAIFEQSVYRRTTNQLLVEGVVQLVCVNGDNRLVPLPESVISRLPAS